MSNKTSPNTYHYNRPEVTFQDTLQNKDEMLKRLENYERVDNIDEVSIDTHVRYVTLDKSRKQVFRLGGLIKRIHPKYLTLSNGTHNWSVQRYHYSDDASNDEPIFETIFWRILTKENILKSKVMELEEELEILHDELDKRTKENIRLKQYIKSQLNHN